jgi:hypothetical protein
MLCKCSAAACDAPLLANSAALLWLPYLVRACSRDEYGRLCFASALLLLVMHPCLLTALHCCGCLTLLERAPGMRMAAYSSGYSPMKFHTEVNTSFTTNGSSFFSLQLNTGGTLIKTALDCVLHYGV